MPRPVASAPPEAIRIEDEVWQEAFTHLEPAKPRRLHAISGGRTPPTPAVTPRRAVPAPATLTPPERVSAAIDAIELPAWQEGPSPGAVGGVPGRRTVTIRGYGAEHNLPWPDSPRRRPQRRAYERTGFRPDRVAMWAVLLGILLVVVAVASAHG
jgi:hypothetical protein